MASPLPLLTLLVVPWSSSARGQEDPSAPRRVPEVFRPGDQSSWVIEQAGARLGWCTSRYEGEVELGAGRAFRFSEGVRLDLPSPGGTFTQLYAMDSWLDAEGHPLRFELRAAVGEVRSSVTGTFADGKAQLDVRQGSAERTSSVDAENSYLLANNFVSQLDLLFALDPPGAEARRWRLFSPNALHGLNYTVKPGTGEGVFEDSLGERLVFENGRLARLEVAPQKLVMRRVAESFEPVTLAVEPTPRAADLDYEDVTITEGEVSLAGTITRPKGAEGRLPAVFFLSGSGGQDRDGYSSGIDVGTHEILDRLTREGFLVLRVDDRGVGGSTGPTDAMTFDDLVADGRRALRFLLAREDVDPVRVALIGHSEGGMSAPLLAGSEPVAAVVLMAAPGRPLEALLGEQLRLGRELDGASPAELEAFDRELERFLQAVAGGDPIPAEGLAPELALFLPARAWLASHLGRDPLPALRALRCPVLALQGGRDVQVSPERDAPRIVAALDEGHNPDHRLELFPELDHLFKKASGEHSSQEDYLRARPVDPAFLQVLVDWLKAHLQG